MKGIIISLLLLIFCAEASAQSGQNVKLYVDIVRVKKIKDGEGKPDYYGVVKIDGTRFKSGEISNNSDIKPGWEFSKELSLSSRSTKVAVLIYDSDSWTQGDDDFVDITAHKGKALDLKVDLKNCQITGDVQDTNIGTKTCGEEFTTSGGHREQSAKVWVKLRVEYPAAVNEDLAIRCSHSPIWPQPGDTVTVTAETFTTKNLSPSRKTVNDLVILDQVGSSQAQCRDKSKCTFSFANVTDDDFFYECRASDSGMMVSSGKKQTFIGNSDILPRLQPVLATGPLSARIDIAFIPDRESYSSAQDPNFLSDVERAIHSYLSRNIFLENQNAFNFWISKEAGLSVAYDNGCNHELPDGWEYSSYAMEVGALIHQRPRATFRNCAAGGENIFSATTENMNVLIHETGHRPFGLADEYCCDGGYFEQDNYPNLYGDEGSCREDAVNLGRVAGDCRKFTGIYDYWFDLDWFTSEPQSWDMMKDNRWARSADKRRINWIIGLCQESRCTAEEY